MTTTLQQAAQAVIDRWDSPSWTWAQGSGDLIHALRLAIEAQPIPPAGIGGEVTDDEIEALFLKCGGKWNGDVWTLEDADLHPFIRTVIAATNAKPSQPVPPAASGEVTDAELTAIYDKANGHAEGKLKPITTLKIFTAMRACLSLAQPVPPVDDVEVQRIALANGFKLKEQPGGLMALNPYVFNFARALLMQSTPPPVARDVGGEIRHAKKLLCDVYNLLGRGSPIRGLIESRTGAWFLWGEDRDAVINPANIFED